MFSWRVRANVDPYFRAVYILEFITVLAMLAGMPLAWWESTDSYNVFNLLDVSADQLRNRDPGLLGQPLIVLWLLWPCIFVSGLRSFTGLLVQPVAFRTLALVAWGVALLVLAHFYVNFGDEAASQSTLSPLRDGDIRAGFWLTISLTALLGLLILLENIIRAPVDPFAGQPKASGPVSDAEKLWRGDYVTCPHCGMLNQPEARSCYNCRNLIFDFGPDD
ncbi:MAG: hypothetical protein JW966_08355 [Anaerolineae bacterium]|nr:hypothetical protein [Anaerolineae bacterium]